MKRPRTPPRARATTQDSFQNLSARLGIGADNLLALSSYFPNYISRNRFQLESMYRGSWLVGTAVDAVAEDMTRAGIEYESDDLTPEEKGLLIQKGERRYAVWDNLCLTLKWARLYGGALAVMLIDGQDPKFPLDNNTVFFNSFKGLVVLDRWMVQPTLEDLVDTFGPDMGLPRYYNVVADSPVLKGAKIHHSRVLRFEGDRLPWYQKMAENLWSQSIVERILDRLIAYDSATLGAAQMTYKAHLRTLKIENLRDLIASGGTVMEGVIKQIDFMRRYQNQEGMSVIDSRDEFQVDTYNFAGLSDILLQFSQQFCGALGIPMVRLFGESPAGLNSTGDSDWENYYNGILRRQESDLRHPLLRLFKVMSRSVLGKPLPEGFDFTFVPLWQIEEKEKGEIAERATATVIAAYEQGLVSAKTVLKEFQQQSHTTGVWTNITDEEIEAADDQLPIMNELGMGGEGDTNSLLGGPLSPLGEAMHKIGGGGASPVTPFPKIGGKL